MPRAVSLCDLPDDVLVKIFGLLFPSVPLITVNDLGKGADAFALAFASSRLLVVARNYYAAALRVIHPQPADDLNFSIRNDILTNRQHTRATDSLFNILHPTERWSPMLALMPFLSGTELRRFHAPPSINARTLVKIMAALARHCAASLLQMSWYEDASVTATEAKSMGWFASKLTHVSTVTVMSPGAHTIRYTLSAGFPNVASLTLRGLHPANLEHIPLMLAQKHSPALRSLSLYTSSTGLLSNDGRRTEEGMFAKFWAYLRQRDNGLSIDAPRLHTLAICTGRSLTASKSFAQDIDRFNREQRVDLPAYTTFEICAGPGLNTSSPFADEQHITILPPWRRKSHRRVLNYQFDVMLPFLAVAHGSDQYGGLSYDDICKRLRQSTVLVVTSDSHIGFSILSEKQQEMVAKMYEEHGMNIVAIHGFFRPPEMTGEGMEDAGHTAAAMRLFKTMIWLSNCLATHGRIRHVTIPTEAVTTEFDEDEMQTLLSVAFAIVMPLSQSNNVRTVRFSVGETLRSRRSDQASNNAAQRNNPPFEWSWPRAWNLLHSLVVMALLWYSELGPHSTDTKVLVKGKRPELLSVQLDHVGINVGRCPSLRCLVERQKLKLREIERRVPAVNVAQVHDEVAKWLD